MISVYTTDPEYRKVFTTSKRIFLTQKPEKSDVILITNKAALQSILNRSTLQNTLNRYRTGHDGIKPILFVTDYRFLKDSEDIVGAFYWRKGRSQLLFIEKRLKEQGIVLPKAYQKFMIDEL